MLSNAELKEQAALEEDKQQDDKEEEELFEVCTIHDFFNTFVASYVIIDIRPNEAYSSSHIFEAINIDPATIDKPNKHINQSKFGKNIAIYGSKDISKNYSNIIQFIITKFTPKNIRVLDDGYDKFKQNYSFICASNGCDSYWYPSIIIPNQLYLGRQRTRNSEKALKDLKISHIVDVTPTEFVKKYKNIEILKIPLQDSDNINIDKYFDEAIDFIDKAFEKKDSRVFVHCQLGISRSTTIIIAWLMKSKGYKLVNAYELCKKCRPQIHPNDGFFEQLIKFEAQIFGESTKEKIDALKLRECVVM